MPLLKTLIFIPFKNILKPTFPSKIVLKHPHSNQINTKQSIIFGLKIDKKSDEIPIREMKSIKKENVFDLSVIKFKKGNEFHLLDSINGVILSVSWG